MRSLMAALGIFGCIAGSARADDAILVLDASGSMWGQIEGKTKVEIARTVVGEILHQLPADRALGLVAYGHRREGDCADIEEIVPVGTDRAAIRAAVGSLKFKGKTPLGASVRFAAEKLRYKNAKATVVLVSDGAETCGVDPCALGRELEAAGVDFTAHVIGFGLASETESAGLRCLAEATGGRYIAARNASELTAALGQTVAAPAEPPAKAEVARVTLRATELDGGPEIHTGLAWEIKPASGAAVFSKSNAGTEEAEVPPGRYDVHVVRASDGLKGAAKLEARAGSERTVTIPLELDLRATLTVTPAKTAPAGSKVSVAWTGPDRKGDYITVVSVGAEPTSYLDYQNTERGNPVEITLPAETGSYEMRYVLGAPQRVLASVPIQTTAVTASLTAPDTAVAGGEVEISWTGPNYSGDWITVVKPDAPATEYKAYFNAEGEKATLRMPLETGKYEIRYVQDGKVVLARRGIAVTAAAAALTAPASAVVGSTVEIAWTGPNDSRDWITVVTPDAPEGTYNDYLDAAADKHTLEMPVEPGRYEIRYVQNGEKILARAPIRLDPATAAITVPPSAKPGAEFEIRWTGPNNPGDWLTIVPREESPDAYQSYVDAPHGSPAKLTAPEAPGTYEVRYVLKGKSVIGRKTIEVK